MKDKNHWGTRHRSQAREDWVPWGVPGREGTWWGNRRHVEGLCSLRQSHCSTGDFVVWSYVLRSRRRLTEGRLGRVHRDEFCNFSREWKLPFKKVKQQNPPTCQCSSSSIFLCTDRQSVSRRTLHNTHLSTALTPSEKHFFLSCCLIRKLSILEIHSNACFG